MEWLAALKKYAEHHPIIVLRLEADEWIALQSSRNGMSKFTIAKPHSLFDGAKIPAPCLILGKSNRQQSAYFGLLSSKGAITTLQSRIKVSRAVVVKPSSQEQLIALVSEASHAQNLVRRLKSKDAVVLLSPKLSSHIVDRLASVAGNAGGLRIVSESLSTPKRFRGNTAFQEDAIQIALRTFGLSADDRALRLELAQGKPTALSRVGIMEDAVVEHDARSVPGYALFQSDVTGRALFHRGDEQLEVFTANRRELEHCLGVDLIYVNRTIQNTVMIQYKMLEPNGKVEEQTDWIYRPDAQLDQEIARMKALALQHSPEFKDYRLNPEIFYLKFVKRDAALAKGGIIMPLGHFEKLRADPTALKGPKNGVRLSYRALNGRYMRQELFLDLLRSGYIGAHACTTEQLRVLIEAILNDDKAVIAAIQQQAKVS